MNNEIDIEEKYPKIFNFFGSYLHQDYSVIYGSIEGTISAYVKDSSKQEILDTIQEIDAIMGDLDSQQLKYVMLNVFGCYCDPDVNGYTAESFLRKIQQQLKDELHLARDE